MLSCFYLILFIKKKIKTSLDISQLELRLIYIFRLRKTILRSRRVLKPARGNGTCSDATLPAVEKADTASQQPLPAPAKGVYCVTGPSCTLRLSPFWQDVQGQSRMSASLSDPSPLPGSFSTTASPSYTGNTAQNLNTHPLTHSGSLVRAITLYLRNPDLTPSRLLCSLSVTGRGSYTIQSTVSALRPGTS